MLLNINSVFLLESSFNWVGRGRVSLFSKSVSFKIAAALSLSEREIYSECWLFLPVAASAEFHSEKYTYANLAIKDKSGFYLIMTPSHFTLNNISERKSTEPALWILFV